MNLNSVSSFVDALSHLVKGSMELMHSHRKITDLDEHSFQHILQYLSFRDIFLCRSVNKYFLKQIDTYLENCRYFTYDCKLNGIHMSNGEYVFNNTIFDFILSKMPNIRVMRFRRCPQMFGALATTNYNIIRCMCNNLIMLNELHITRSRALDRTSLKLLVDWFPNLTHLTITVYNESSVEIIVKGLANLKYFNLDQSVINDYGHHLKHLGLKIHTFVAAPDHNNHKNSIIDGLLKGNGRYIKELEMRIKVFDCDQTLFDKIGQEFSELSSVKLLITSRRTLRNNKLFSGLSKLSEMKRLHLEEKKIFCQFYSVFDDDSMLSIMRGCRLLESLILISGGRHRKTCDGTIEHCLTDSSLSLIDQLLPNIGYLTLKSVDITDKTLDSIERLRKLKSLRLDSLSAVSSNGIQNFMANATQINGLEVINCFNYN